jgi:hypothetical protein
MTNNREAALLEAFNTHLPVMTPKGQGIITCWNRFYAHPGLLDEDDVADDIEVRLENGEVFATDTWTDLTVIA